MALATLPFLGTLITYFFPAWRVTSLTTITSNDTSITSNATSQVIWEGLLMNCVTQRMARMQCDSSNMILASPQVLLAVRVLFITVLFVSLWGFCMAAPGRRCGEYSEDGEEIEVGKARAEFTNGIPFIVWGLLIRITWVTVNIAQGRDRYSNQAGEMEMVASLYHRHTPLWGEISLQPLPSNWSVGG
ncbi:claudin-4-like [Coregonus clupeaformis]|uniref:claudin-4-like n=1 Tax=Coregonus clupeaformis TaxID=59861 RepID=UPI001E1C56F7|nr:claudin-4-like [Coregonus clupeaformis]